MYPLTSQIIISLIAIYLLWLGANVETKNTASATVFKFIPIMSATMLVLIVFGVIK